MLLVDLVLLHPFAYGDAAMVQQPAWRCHCSLLSLLAGVLGGLARARNAMAAGPSAISRSIGIVEMLAEVVSGAQLLKRGPTRGQGDASGSCAMHLISTINPGRESSLAPIAVQGGVCPPKKRSRTRL